MLSERSCAGAPAPPPRGPPAPHALGRQDRTGGARLGAGAGLWARPARTACAALPAPAVRPHGPSPAELSHSARKIWAGTGRHAAGGSRGLRWGHPGTRGCVEALPPSGECHLRPRRLRNWTGGAWGVGRKGCRRGAAGGGAPGGGLAGRQGAEGLCGAGRAGVAPNSVPTVSSQPTAWGQRHRAHTVPPRQPSRARTEPHSPPARPRVGARALRGVRASVPLRFCGPRRACACRAGWAAGAAAQAPSQPRCSRASAAHADAASVIYRASLRRPRWGCAGVG